MNWLKAFIRFSRPHTIIGTTLSVVCLYTLAHAFSDVRYFHRTLVGLTLLSCLGANIFIVGLNQITDIAIDKINKPYLPLASGVFSKQTGYVIIVLSVILSLGIALYYGGYLLLTVLLSLVLGTAYSLPPFRLKRFYFWAAFCIIAVRGMIVNLLLFLHFHSIMNGQHILPPSIWLLTGIIFIYSIVIAWFKDIPDMEGDAQHRISTLSLKLGPHKVFLAGNGLILGSIVFLGIAYRVLEPELNPNVMIAAHVLFAVLLVWKARQVKLAEPSSVFSYYQFIWVLFFFEYVSFAVAGLTA